MQKTSKVGIKKTSKVGIKKTSKVRIKKTSKVGIKKTSKVGKKTKTKQSREINLTSGEKNIENIMLANPKINTIYQTLKFNIMTELKKLGYNIYIVLLPLLSDNTYDYEYDYLYDYIKRVYSHTISDDEKYFCFVFFMDQIEHSMNLSMGIQIKFSHLDLNQKIQVIDLFEKYLKHNFLWCGTNNHLIRITFLAKKDNTPIDRNKLKNDDRYPLLQITIFTDITKLQNMKILIDYFENMEKDYDLIWNYNENNFVVHLYCFELSEKNKDKLIEIKIFLNKQSFIKKYEFLLDDSKSLFLLTRKSKKFIKV